MTTTERDAVDLIADHEHLLDIYYQMHFRHIKRTLDDGRELTGVQLAMISGMLRQLGEISDKMEAEDDSAS